MQKALLPFMLIVSLFSHAIGNDSIPNQFLPDGLLFKPVFLDPNQANISGSINGYWKDKQPINGQYATYALGASKSLIRWVGKENRRYEWGMDLGATGQFEWKTVDTVLQLNFINVDFKVSSFLNIKWNEKHSMRIRMYHTSSHTGDDYMIRNGIRSFIPNYVNYEQLDILHSVNYKYFRFYYGLGANVRGITIRKRAFMELGFETHIPMTKRLDFFVGSNCKIWEQNSFVPGINSAMGIAFKGEHDRRLYMVIHYYQGKSPFSQYQFTDLRWLGVAAYFSPY
ncbi:MAG: DUF1207 domain-containing protein [Bacteroidetes bacterium]|nr:DUF1207 domain-containing protein [Bacteroidota bacterium]